MSVLSDRTLEAYLSTGRLVVTPLAEGAIGPNSIDVTFGPDLSLLISDGVIDTLTSEGARYDRLPLNGHGGWTLYPDNLYLASTAEWVEIPPELVCWFDGRSTLGRFGVSVHVTAGLIDAGYRGQITAEIEVVKATRLYPGQPLGQLVFARLATPAERPYGERGRYQNSRGAVPPVPFSVRREAVG